MHRDEVKAAFQVAVFAVALQFDFLAVDGQPLVAVRDLITGQADDALDVVERRIDRIAENHDIAALRRVHVDDLLVDHGEPDAVRKLVHQDEVADKQRRQHGARGNLERLDEKRAQQEHDQDHREEALRVLDPPGLLPAFLAALRQHPLVERGDRSRHDEQDEHDKREVHSEPVRRKR
jgi:hypothetical protein